MPTLFALPPFELFAPARPDVVYAGTEIRFFTEGTQPTSFVITGRVRCVVRQGTQQYAVLEAPGDESEDEQFYDAISMLDDLYYESKPYKPLLEFCRWTTPSSPGTWGNICVHFSLILRTQQLRSSALSWIEDATQSSPAVERGAVVRFVVQLQRIDQPISVAADGEVLLWRVSWKIAARSICRLLPLAQPNDAQAPKEVIATPTSEDQTDVDPIRMPVAGSLVECPRVLVT